MEFSTFFNVEDVFIPCKLLQVYALATSIRETFQGDAIRECFERPNQCLNVCVSNTVGTLLKLSCRVVLYLEVLKSEREPT